MLYRALHHGQELIAGRQTDATRIRMAMQALISREPLARLDYLSIADRDVPRAREDHAADAALAGGLYRPHPANR